MAKHNVQIDDSELYQQIVEYCKLNELKIGAFITEMVRKQFMIEQYGDVPFTTYETNIIRSEPVSSITIETVINVPQEKLDVIKDSKEVYGEVSHPDATFLPFDLTTSTKTDTNKPISSAYTKSTVPDEYYGEINFDKKETIKPKKRRL